MIRKYILLVLLLIHCSGCPDDKTAPPIRKEITAAKQSDSPAVNGSNSPVESDSESDSPLETSKAASPTGDDVAKKDAMTLYREAQELMKGGDRKAGYETAEKAMAQFIAEDVELAWMMLESITAGDKRIDVHFNMGNRERDMPDDGIVRPLSFRIWSQGDDPDLLQIIDFEIGRSSGKSITAAIGEMTGDGHSNYGLLDVDADYETIRKRVIDFVTGE